MAFPAPVWASGGPSYPAAVASFVSKARGEGERGDDDDGVDVDVPSTLPGKSKTAKKRAAARAATFDSLVSGVVKLPGLVSKAEKKKEERKGKKEKKRKRDDGKALAAGDKGNDGDERRRRKEKRKEPVAAVAAPASPPALRPPVAEREAKRKKPSKRNKYAALALKERAEREEKAARAATTGEANAASGAAPPTAQPLRAKGEGKGEKRGEQVDEDERRPTTTSTPSSPPPTTKASPKTPPLDFLAKHRARLSGGAFRSLNEELYTRPGSSSKRLLESQPGSFEQYHSGFRAATESWPELPVQRAARDLSREFEASKGGRAPLVVDFGCGEAWLGDELSKNDIKTLSLDLVSTRDDVVACDVASGPGAVPLSDGSADAAVFCLALMSTDYPEALREASRVLADGGLLWIAEVRSRFSGANDADDDDGRRRRKNEGDDRRRRQEPKEDVGPFVRAVRSLGFEHVSTDGGNKMFVVMTFRRRRKEGGDGGGGKRKKGRDGDGTSGRLFGGRGVWPSLRPCSYKKR